MLPGRAPPTRKNWYVPEPPVAVMVASGLPEVYTVLDVGLVRVVGKRWIPASV
jgi:hypothetical protein